MVKRYCVLLYTVNGYFSPYITPGFGILLFKTEKNAIKYLKESGRKSNFAIISIVYTQKDVAKRQTFKI